MGCYSYASIFFKVFWDEIHMNFLHSKIWVDIQTVCLMFWVNYQGADLKHLHKN